MHIWISVCPLLGGTLLQLVLSELFTLDELQCHMQKCITLDPNWSGTRQEYKVHLKNILLYCCHIALSKFVPKLCFCRAALIATSDTTQRNTCCDVSLRLVGFWAILFIWLCRRKKPQESVHCLRSKRTACPSHFPLCFTIPVQKPTCTPKKFTEVSSTSILRYLNVKLLPSFHCNFFLTCQFLKNN